MAFPMTRTALAAVDDLFFSTKIESAAKILGIRLLLATDAFRARALLDESEPDLVILDLSSRRCAPLDLIPAIKSDPRLSRTRLIGFLSHIQKELETAARTAGCDLVLPRSVFSAKLARILETGEP
jgi:CheY-like chemotaxis protein